MNIILTTRCNRTCSFCFIPPSRYMGDFPLESLKSNLALLSSWRINRVGLLGGEPTLHPSYPVIVSVAAESFREVVVFTNGSSVDTLEQADSANVKYCINLSAEMTGTCEVPDGLADFVIPRRHRTAVSLTLTDAIVDPARILAICQRLRVTHMRWSLAQPNPVTENTSWHGSGRSLSGLLIRLLDGGVSLEQDCQMPLCTLSDSEVGKVVKASRGPVLQMGRCEPSLDLWPDGSITYCAALASRTRVPLSDFRSFKELLGFFRVFRAALLQELPEGCDKCSHFTKGMCQGGCLASRA